MKLSYIAIIFAYIVLAVFAIAFTLMGNFDITLDMLTSDLWRSLQVLFALVLLAVSLTILLSLLWWAIDEHRQRQFKKYLDAILNNRDIRLRDDSDISLSLSRLSLQMKRLTSILQKTENVKLQDKQDIIKQERRRIARDLHDTVSQELFASSLILSGLSQSIDQLEGNQVKQQLLTAEHILTDAQKDLRVLLLHLRPTELEGKSLADGLSMILRELTDKSDIEVVYHEDIGYLPKAIEENLFRIAQEFISNTLKHAQANRLEVYLKQSSNDVLLKMVDDGQGFDTTVVRELSYGLKNIEDRVDDLAGNLTFLSSPGHGVAMTVRLPLVTGEDDGKD